MLEDLVRYAVISLNLFGIFVLLFAFDWYANIRQRDRLSPGSAIFTVLVSIATIWLLLEPM